MKAHLVEQNAPLLISKRMFWSLGGVLSSIDSNVVWHSIGVAQDVVNTASGHVAIRIDEFGSSIDVLRDFDCWEQVNDSLDDSGIRIYSLHDSSSQHVEKTAPHGHGCNERPSCGGHPQDVKEEAGGADDFVGRVCGREDQESHWTEKSFLLYKHRIASHWMAIKLCNLRFGTT